MKDLDFDELDRAVNSLTSSQQQPDEDAEPKPPTASPAEQSSKSVDDPELDKDIPALHNRPVIAFAPGHRAGRLGPNRTMGKPPRGVIDIMAPKPASHVMSPKTPSRVAADLQPVSDQSELKATQKDAPEREESIVPVVRPSLVEKPEEVSAPEAPAKPASPAKPTTEERWPDPLDFHAGHKEEPDEPASPFISGAKVDKRPLGAFATYSQPESATPEDKAADASAPVETPTPASTPDEPAAKETAAELTEDAKLFSSDMQHEAADIHKEVADDQAHLPSADEQLRHTATLSIPQQYHVGTKKPDTTTHPIFDTKEYHPPLLEETAHAAHHRLPIWIKLFIVLLIIMVLAVLGYIGFGYFMHV